MRHTYFCIDGHTCGNQVRLVVGGAPALSGATMLDRRAHFVATYDWVRTGLMFEPRGHALMSGALLLPSTRDDCDAALLYIETTGCNAMCGHATIGAVTMMIEHGLVRPRTPGQLMIDTPAGPVAAYYTMDGDYVAEVRLTNVASFVHATGVALDVPGLGPLTVDIAYGGNFYAIIDPQPGFAGIEAVSVQDILRWSPAVRDALAGHGIVHPERPDIAGVRHVLWAGAPRNSTAHARNAVFYGDGAIDRSPCGTGTSARMAQWAAQGRLGVGDAFVHESLIGSLFHGRVEAVTTVAGRPAIVPSVAGWARITGHNTITIDDRDPYAHGFVVR